MKVRELIERLRAMPPEAEVVIEGEKEGMMEIWDDPKLREQTWGEELYAVFTFGED